MDIKVKWVGLERRLKMKASKRFNNEKQKKNLMQR